MRACTNNDFDCHCPDELSYPVASLIFLQRLSVFQIMFNRYLCHVRVLVLLKIVEEFAL